MLTKRDLNLKPVKLQRRHFALIAGIIREMPNKLDRRYVGRHFALRLGRTNPDFDADRFMKACED